MKLYLFALASLLAAAGSASANVDYMGCSFGKHRSYNDSDRSHYCGDQSRNDDGRDFANQNYNGGNSSNSNNY